MRTVRVGWRRTASDVAARESTQCKLSIGAGDGEVLIALQDGPCLMLTVEEAHWLGRQIIACAEIAATMNDPEDN